jgi:hypothetical protein
MVFVADVNCRIDRLHDDGHDEGLAAARVTRYSPAACSASANSEAWASAA